MGVKSAANSFAGLINVIEPLYIEWYRLFHTYFQRNQAATCIAQRLKIDPFN